MKIRNLFVAIAVLVVIGFVAEQSMAQRPNNLFSQYYTQGASPVHAAMYPAPHPTPRHVGQAHYTYQPLMPHELMYQHQRSYYNYYATPASFYCNQCGINPRSGYGVTKTTVRWQNGCTHMAPLPGVSNPFSRLGYRWHTHGSVPRGPINNLLSCNGGGCGLGLVGKFGNCLGGNCGDLYSDLGLESEYGNSFDSHSGWNGCEGGCAVDWNNVRQQSAARTAAAMQNRYGR